MRIGSDWRMVFVALSASWFQPPAHQKISGPPIGPKKRRVPAGGPLCRCKRESSASCLTPPDPFIPPPPSPNPRLALVLDKKPSADLKHFHLDFLIGFR